MIGLPGKIFINLDSSTQIIGDDLYTTNLERLKIGFLKSSSNAI